MKHKNMKIYINKSQSAKDIFKELNRLGYKYLAQESLYSFHCVVICRDFGLFYPKCDSDELNYDVVTLEELKGMK